MRKGCFFYKNYVKVYEEMESIITVNVKNNQTYDIVITDNFEGLGDRLLALYEKERKLCIIADKNVYDIYGEGFEKELKKKI